MFDQDLPCFWPGDRLISKEIQIKSASPAPARICLPSDIAPKVWQHPLRKVVPLRPMENSGMQLPGNPWIFGKAATIDEEWEFWKTGEPVVLSVPEEFPR